MTEAIPTRVAPRPMTDDERATIVHLYTVDGMGLVPIARRIGRDKGTVRRVLSSEGIARRPPRGGRGARTIDPDNPLFQPHVAYCGLCNQKALYVFTEVSGGGNAAHDGGHILELDPHPNGRWADRGDGIFYVRHRAPEDGSGRRPHNCGSAR